MSLIEAALTVDNLATASAWVAGIVLLTAGVGKIATVREFGKLLAAYEILPESAIPIFSLAIPLCEMCCGAALLLGLFQPVAGFGAGGVFLLFAAAITCNLLRGRRELTCGCFGGSSKQISWHLVARNVVLAGLAISSTGALKNISIVLIFAYGGSALLRWSNGFSLRQTSASATSGPR